MNESPPPAATPTASDSASDVAVATVLAPWSGDLDGMVERRYIRILITFNKTN